MATAERVLKNIVNLNTTKIISIEPSTRLTTRFGDPFELEVLKIHVEPYVRMQHLCPICQQACQGYDHPLSHESSWRANNLNGVIVELLYNPARVYCPEHGVHRELIPWADGNSRFTPEFNNEITWMATRMPRTDISLYMIIDWATVGNCITACRNRLEPDLSNRLVDLRKICVDETSIHKGHKYITVVYDMERNRVIWISKDHGLEVFEKFCLELNEEQRSKIEVVAGDGAKWIDTCTSKYFPNAKRCIDPFHVVSWSIEALDDVRKDTYAKATRELKEMSKINKQLEEAADNSIKEELSNIANTEISDKSIKKSEEFINKVYKIRNDEGTMPELANSDYTPRQKYVIDTLEEIRDGIRGSKYALGKNPENLTQNQRDKLELIANSFPDIYLAYQLKEELRIILHMKDVEGARNELEKWIEKCLQCTLQPMVKLGRKIARHKDHILLSVECMANSAKSEACNGQIKMLINMARGFRNYKNMANLIYLKCSDIVVPLNNRFQLSPEKIREIRERNMEIRRSKKLAKRPCAAA